jgi:Glycosyl transferase family 2
VSVAAIFHYKFKSFEEFNRKQCERGDIYKKVKHTCPATVQPGDVFDDSAWRAMSRLLPKYAEARKLEYVPSSKQQSTSDARANQILPTESRNDTSLPVEGLDMNNNSSLEELSQNQTENGDKPWAALCAVMRDEDLYVNEWTNYHLALGFEHIFIYDSHPNFTLSEWYSKRVEQEGNNLPHNMSTANRVHLTHRVLPDTGKVQELVYGECLDKLRALDDPPKWVMVLDGDEFLVFRDMDKYPNVVTFLTDQLHSGSLQINWVVMGSANETAYRDEPVTKRFQLALSGSQYPETKAVAILDHVTGWRVHYAYHKPGYGSIGMGGRRVGLAGALCCIKNGDVSVAAIFHYKFKSFEEFNRKQCERGDIYKAITHSCPATVQPGDVFDDSAWRAMTRLLPKYASLHGHRDGEALVAR